MKRIIILLVAALILLSLFALYRNTSARAVVSSLGRSGQIKSGDLVYRIYLFGILPIAEAVLGADRIEDYQNQSVYHLHVTAQSLRCYSALLFGSAVIDSFVDRNTHNPILFQQRLTLKGKPTVDKVATYDQKEGVMVLDGVRRQILPNTQDPLSVIFNLRRMDFDTVKELEISINTNQKNYVLRGLTRQNVLSIGGKDYSCVLADARISRRDKNPYHKSRIVMTLLKEAGNLPVLIKVFASGVFINARLVEIR